MLDDINQRLDRIDQRLDRIDRRLDLMEIRRLVDRARNINNRIHRGQTNAQFITVVKHTFDHPNFNPPQIDNVNLNAHYNIGDQPPDNLVPMTYAQLDELGTAPLADLRRILRAIFWFYNDPTLQLAANSSLVNCITTLQKLKSFITEI